MEFSTGRLLATLETSFLEAIEVEVRLQSTGERMRGEETERVNPNPSKEKLDWEESKRR